MFIITIIVLGIIIYLAYLNSRINSLENKIGEKTKPIFQQHVQEIKSEPIVEKKPEPIVVHHQDTFAQNLAKFAIAVLILGVIFFLKYIDSQGWIGPVLKFTSGLVFGIILLGIAEYLRSKNKTYSNLLRGASFITMYVTLFVGYILFHIISLPVTLGLLIAVLAISSIISLRENDQLPFTLGALGAYAVSFFIGLNIFSIGNENLIGIMLYLLVLNTAIIFISLKKDWLNSTVIGFVFTWLIFASILSTDITKNILFIFSSLYGLQYLIIFLIQDFQNVKSKAFNVIKGTVFLTALNTLIYLLVFYKLVDKTVLFDYVGFFVALLGVFHFAVYMFIRNINKDSQGVIALTHFVISILLVSAAVSLQLDGPLVTMIWFLEGVVLSFLSVLKDFKDKAIMYILGFTAVVAGICHMILFGHYESVMKNGLIFLNQKYIVWFAVFLLINLIVYIWKNTVVDSINAEFKNMINKTCFALILIGQIMFVVLTSIEINEFGSYRNQIINKEIRNEMNLDRGLNGGKNIYDNYKYEERYKEIYSVNRQTTFMQMLLFIIMTIIYFIAGLIYKNKIVRNMGIVTLIITSLLLITLTWNLGPVYRIITFIGFGIALLIVSYLYISKNKRTDIVKTFMLLFIIGLLSVGSNIDAKTIDIKNWTTIANIRIPELTVQDNNENQNLYVLPIDKDIINISKRVDLSDIRLIDKDKNEIPYIIVKSNQNTQDISTEKIKVKILENSTTRDNKKTLVLDTNREGLLYNRIFMTHDNKSLNFRKKVKIYISDVFLTASSPAWSEVEQRNVIYNYTDAGNFSVEKMNIDLTGISSRYVKIELSDDIEFDKNIKTNNRLTINNVEIEYIKNENNDIGFQIKDYLSGKFSFDNLSILKDIKLLDNIQKDNRSELIFEGEIDVEDIILNIDKSDDMFNRNLVVQGSNDDVNWTTISNGNIYRINSPIYKGEKLNIKIPVSTYKKFKLIIQDNNDKPLNISKYAKVKIQNTGVIFRLDETVNISDIKIIVGNNTELSPIYDMKSIINYFENVTPKTLKYDNLVDNPDYKPAKNIIPFGERNKVFLNIGLIIFIVIMGIFGFFWMKKDTNYEIK